MSEHCLQGFIFLFSFLSGWLDPQFTKFEFSVEPQDLYVSRNQPAVLNCEANVGREAASRPTVRWKKDGQFLQFPDFNDRR